MIRHLLAGAAGVAALAALTIAPAQAAAFTVTLTSDVGKADVGQTFRLSGKVTGSGSASKKIIVQRKVLTDKKPAWKDFSTITTRKTGTYAKVFTVKSVGAKQYRVLAPKTSNLTTGTSNTKTVTGYTWLKLIDQPYLTSGGGIIVRGYSGQLNGKVPPSDTFTLAGQTVVRWNLGGLCDSVHGSVGVNDDGVRPPQTFTIERGSDEETFTISRGESRSLDWDATDASSFVVKHTNGSTNGDYVALVAPRAHCSTSRLPLAVD